jgi:hypothetical protein
MRLTRGPLQKQCGRLREELDGESDRFLRQALGRVAASS